MKCFEFLDYNKHANNRLASGVQLYMYSVALAPLRLLVDPAL
jgi:hypothetical protein